VNQINRLSSALLRSPLLWGTLLSVGFFTPIETGAITNSDVLRYFAGHWVNYVETVAFFVALSALALKALDVGGQLAGVTDPILSPAPAGGNSIQDCPRLTEDVADYEQRNGEGYLSRRLHNALAQVTRKGSPDTLESEIKYLGECDLVAAAQSYGFIKIIIWAIPILGFLGTVIGITIAIANLNPQQLESSLSEVTGGLGVAFDTTALALALSMVLMFLQYFVDKYENGLLATVERRMNEELVGRFQPELAPQDPLLLAVRRMVDAILPNMDRLVARQTELWQASMDAAGARWIEMSQKAGRQLESALDLSLSKSLQQHAETLAIAEKEMAEVNRQHWLQIRESFERAGTAIEKQQVELARQGELLLKVTEGTEQIGRLEQVLNGNLQALAGAKNFEETVVSLAAAIQLLTARLGRMPAEGRAIELPRHKNMVQAA
jgi:hypothetical protein